MPAAAPLNVGEPTFPGDVAIGANSAGAQMFTGTIDDVRIYDRVLSAAEVRRLYKLGTVTLSP
jgi:hypothetical protein